MLDTDHLGILQWGEGFLFRTISSRLAVRDRSEFCVSIVSFHEQFNGWQAYLRKHRTPAQLEFAYEQLHEVIRDYQVWQIALFNQAAAERFETLPKQGIRIGTMDLRIASIALVGDYTVLTRNLVDFEKVPELKVEDRTAGAAEETK